MGVFIAVALLLALMNILFFYLLVGAARRLGRYSRRNMLREGNVYDELIENKELELRELLRKLEEAEARLASADPAAGFGGGAAGGQTSANFFTLTRGRYLDREFTSGYQALRNSFAVDERAAVETVRRAQPINSGGNAAKELLEEIPLDTRYSLALLPREEATALLRETLGGRKRELLDTYLAESDGDVVGFFDWLNVRAFMDAPELVVRTGDPGRGKGDLGSGVTAEYDPGVCEGVYVIANGKMYDFSIKSREIGG
jgi:hypothetical protein